MVTSCVIRAAIQAIRIEGNEKCAFTSCKHIPTVMQFACIVIRHLL